MDFTTSFGVSVAILTSRLAQLGYPVTEGLDVALAMYQGFHGLEITGQIDSPTIRNVGHHRFCGLPDVMTEQLGENVCKWNTKDPSTGETVVYWTIVSYLSRFSKDQLKAAYESAWASWADVCGLRPVYVEDPARAMVLMGTRSIDRAGGVLAESELPCGNVRLCRQWYDTNEPWVFSDNAVQGQVDIGRVARHEIGHVLGINHGPGGNLMAPAYSQSITQPQAWDIDQGRTRYGPPVTILPPPPLGEIVIKIRGSIIEIPGYRVTKLA